MRSPRRLKTVTTNADGGTGAPLLEGGTFTAGLRASLPGRRLPARARRSTTTPSTLFLDVIPVRFGIADPNQHYHVPLLLSAHGYST